MVQKPVTLLRRMKPAVPQQWLLLIAGILWTVAGAGLSIRALLWISAAHSIAAIAFGAAGIGLAWAASRFVLQAAAQRNIKRIFKLPPRACVFAFTAWNGYGMIAMMMVVGITVRHSPVPKMDLAPFYLAMGGALVLASLEFYKAFVASLRTPTA